jgi:hypothetical protein
VLRLELKFVIHHSVRRMLLERWSPHLVKAAFTDQYARTPVLSQYYDSPTLSFSREKDDGIPIRNKVRLRTYATDYDSGGVTFLEIKHRRFVGVRKHRQQIANMSSAHLCPSRWTFDEPDMEAKFRSLIETYHLRASAQTYYQREAYESPHGDGLRVTLDSNLVGLHPGERLTTKLLLDRSRSLMADTLFVLEIKSNNVLPRWVHDGIIACELEQKTIPKYVTAVNVLKLGELTGAGVYL